MKKEGVVLSALILAACTNIYLPKIPLYDCAGTKVRIKEDYENKHGASATYIENVPVIKYNPNWMQYFPEEFQTFVFYHEYGHITLGHNFSYRPRSIVENEADCFSVLFLKEKLNYGQDEFKKIYKIAYFEFNNRRANEILECLSKK